MNWQAFQTWWKQPFNINASGTDWILFTGFILAVIFLWTRVLREAGHFISETV